MTRERARGCRAGGRVSAAVLMLALLGSGCSSSSLLGNSQPAPEAATSADAARSTSFRERMTALFGAKPAPSPEPPANAASSAAAQAVVSEDCPTVDVRSGASTYAVGPPGADPTATTLRYQATVARTARECSIMAGTMTVKVGVQGRVVLGPAGGPGQLEIPIRLALVQEGVDPKTIWTKAYRVPVTIAPGQSNVPFVQIEEDISFPLPKPAELDTYIIYVGFDPALVKEPEKKPPPKKKPRAAG